MSNHQQYPQDPNQQRNFQYDPQQPEKGWQPAQQFQPKRKKSTRTNVLIGVGTVIGGLILIGALGNGGEGPAQQADSAPLPNVVTTTADTGPSPDPVVTPTNKPAPVKPSAKPTPAPKPKATQPSMTASQEQAIGSAESYLSFTAFSRKGLIRQLSSDAGEGFSVADATYAVDHIKVNWNEQAAKSAKSYLAMTHFSRKGLIHQLESSAGDGYTHAQAVYGVTKAGL